LLPVDEDLGSPNNFTGEISVLFVFGGI